MTMSWWPLIKTLPVKTNFRFVRFARLFGILSALLCAASLIGVFYPGLNLGIDFRGGAAMEMTRPGGQALDLAAVRGAVDDLGLGDVQVQGIDSDSSAIVRFQIPEGTVQADTVNRVQAAIAEAVPDARFSGTSVVGSKVSGELLTAGVLALVVAVVLMFLYIAFRFPWQFGLGAVFGLVHDVVLVFGLMVLMQLEFSLNSVAAILTVIGYSMNDTVVVFDRLRENLRKYKTMPLRDIIDLSVNETLSRTIITGITAVMVLAALAVLGGPALFAFSIALMFGIIIGTYSSVYIAAPVILVWGVKRGESAEDAQPVVLGPASRP
jgi:preprotein translocase subunit SecF/SecD/SecF fusion protein